MWREEPRTENLGAVFGARFTLIILPKRKSTFEFFSTFILTLDCNSHDYRLPGVQRDKTHET